VYVGIGCVVYVKAYAYADAFVAGYLVDFLLKKLSTRLHIRRERISRQATYLDR